MSFSFQVASKSVSEICGTDLSVQFLNNAPIAVIKNYKNKGNKVKVTQRFSYNRCCY